jgi:mono/diheme cytochrome c family protein
MHKLLVLPAVLGLLAITGCGDDAPPRATDQPPPAATPPTPAAGTIPAELPPGVTAEMVSEGQRLYGGVCVACHGQGGTGGPLGPALNDQNWIHIGGEFDEIVAITTTGVAQPRQYPAPMPPMGGGNYTPDQVRAISAYVYSISHSN